MDYISTIALAVSASFAVQALVITFIFMSRSAVAAKLADTLVRAIFDVSLEKLAQTGSSSGSTTMTRRSNVRTQESGEEIYHDPEANDEEELFLAAVETFGSPDKARKWIDRPTSPLLGFSPRMAWKTTEGRQEVRVLLGRIAHGLAA